MPARPRDRLGRPLPPGATGFPGVPEREEIGADHARDEAMSYLDAGLPFHAHEVCEQRWRCCPPAEREVWRALAQATAGLTHEARGNPEGARRLAERARTTLAAAEHIPSQAEPLIVRLLPTREC